VKPFLTIFGSVGLVIIILPSALLAYGFYISYALSPSADAYADTSLHAILSTGSKDELLKRASPGFIANTNQGQFDQVFVVLGQLGKFRTCSGLSGNVKTEFSFKKGLATTATYDTTAAFQRGKCDITIVIVRDKFAWKISHLNLNGTLDPVDPHIMTTP
jgi:hypothetical protein